MAAQEKRKEFCAILGVDEQASKEEIKRAYKQLALQCHPDKNQLNPEATREFQKISEAYTGLCQEDIDSADEDINDFDGGVSLFELLQLFFSINRRRPFFMRSPSSWFSRYSEDSDEVNDSDDACGPVRQNIRNHAGQQAWNDDNHFVPGNARPQSSSKDAGKTGKAKKRKNRRGGGGAASSQNNNNQSSDRQGTASAGTNASTGSNTSASTNAGTAENRTSTLDQDGLATEATSENQLPGRAGVNDQGANQGGGSDAKPGFIPEPATDNNNSGENPERRGSNGSLRGTGQISQGQAAEKKPNKKKLQAEQRIREKEYAEIHRAVLEKNRKEEEKRKKKMEKEKAKLDTEFTPKLNAMARDESKTAVNDCVSEVDPSAERQNDRHGTSAETNDAKDPGTSDTASLDSDSRLAKHMEGGLSLESSETIDSIGIEEITSDNGQSSADRKASAVSFDEERFDENHPEIGCNGDAVGSSQGERQKFTRVFYGHSSKNQSKNNPRYNRNFDNADGGNTVGGHFPPQRGSGYRGRVDNANYRPHTNNSGFVERSFYRGFHNNSERDGPLNNEDQSGCTTSEEANSNAGVKDSSGPANRGQYGRGRYRSNRMRYQNTRFRNASELPDDQSKSTNCDGPGQDVDRSNGVVAVDVKPSGDGTSLDSMQNLPNSEPFRSQRGTDESSVREGSLLSCNGHRGGYTADNSETSKKAYWPRSNRNFRGQRGNFRGGFDGGGGGGRNSGDQNHASGGFRSKPVQECWDSEGSKSHVDQVDNSAVEMPVAERGKGQHRGRRPDRGGFQRGGRGGGKAFNSSNSQENWDLEGRTVNHVDHVESAKEAPVHETGNEPYRGSRPDRGQFQRDGGGRGRGRGFGQARDRTGEAQPRGNRAAEWEPGKKRFERGSSSNYDCEEYNGATMQFHRRRQTPGEAAQVPPSAANTMAQHQSPSDSVAASDGGMEWTSRSSEGHPDSTSGPRNVWKDRQEFYEGALPRSKEEEDAMLRAALQLSELEIEEQRLSEQVQSSGLSLSFTSSSVVGRSSEAEWTADVLDIVTVEPHPPRQRPAENAATDNAHSRLQPQDSQAEDDRRATLDGLERLVVPTSRLKSWADEMEETNDTGANADAYPSDSVAESDADSVRSPRLQGKMTHNSWALMNFGTPSDAASSEEAKNLPSNHSESEIKAVVSTVRDTIVHPTAPGISNSSAMQLNRDVSDGVVRPRDMPGTSEQLGAREPLQRQTSMLDDIDDGAVAKENPQNMPPDHIQAASASAIESRVFHASPFPPFARHMPEAENPTAPDFSAENNRGEAVVDLPVSPGLPCPAFPPGPMPPMPPWMQPGCPTYFVAVPGYPPWYPMPPYQHYWPYMPSGAPGMPGVMPMVSQSLSLAHSSNVTDQPTVSQHLQMSHPNSLPLQGPSAVPHLPPSMPTMMHPIPYGYPPHPAHLGHPGAAMHVPFAPYTMSPSETVGSTALLQETGSPTNYTDESKRCA